MDKQLLNKLLRESDCDAASVAVIDFNSNRFEVVEARESSLSANEPIYYDLASLSKPLNNSNFLLSQNIIDEKLHLLANHQAGLPSWGLLSRDSWSEQIKSYQIKKSPTLYSDFSALRFMLEVQSQLGVNLKDKTLSSLDSEVCFWDNLEDKYCLVNGHQSNYSSHKFVHDPNAFALKNYYVNHAGLFGTIEGISRSLIKMNASDTMLSVMNGNPKNNRFFYGFDTVTNSKSTLAGAGCSVKTFGHLGFTGTSFWIDPELRIGHVILTNATKKYWYNKKELNEFRREIGQLIWKNFKR